MAGNMKTVICRGVCNETDSQELRAARFFERDVSDPRDGVCTSDYPRHNTNYRTLISKYVGGGTEGGEARTTGVLGG